MKTHLGVYYRRIFGGRPFFYAFTRCTNQMLLKTTNNKKKVTCERCKKYVK